MGAVLMGERKHRLVDCNPTWAEAAGLTCYVIFDCPEGHEDCRHAIPFRQSLEGPIAEQAGAMWDRTGDTFETLTLTPSIRRIQRYPNREAALAAGCIDEHITETLFCALHIFITDGHIQFCGDSK
jgi:hypothetical protein